MSNYGRANTTAQWFQDDYPGAAIDPDKIIWHSTESSGWPGYGGGKSAPTYTCRWNFAAKRWDWRAHFPDERSARALQNDSGGVETNRDGVIQVEIVGTCDPKAHRTWTVQHVYTPEMTPEMIDGLALFALDMKRRHGIPLAGRTMIPYPQSYGDNAGQRMSYASWRSFTGHCGHQHVPENDHGDPGAFPLSRILQRAAVLERPTPPSPPAPAPTPPAIKEDEMFLASVPGEDPRVFLVLGNGKRHVPNTAVVAALKAAGIRDAGDVAVAALNMFPSLEGLEGAEAGWRTSTAQTLAGLAQAVSNLSTAVADDASAAQVEEIQTRLEQLRADLDPEGDPTP